MSPRPALVALVAGLVLATGCSSDDGDSDQSWSTTRLQADLAKGVAGELGVDPDEVEVSCPKNLDPTSNEPVAMECTATVTGNTHTIEVTTADTDDDTAFRWRLAPPTD